MCGFNDGVDAVNEELGANGNENGNEDKRHTGGSWRQDLGLLLVFATLLALDVGKEVVVRVELEVEVQDVEDEQDDGGTMGED